MIRNLNSGQQVLLSDKKEFESDRLSDGLNVQISPDDHSLSPFVEDNKIGRWTGWIRGFGEMTALITECY